MSSRSFVDLEQQPCTFPATEIWVDGKPPDEASVLGSILSEGARVKVYESGKSQGPATENIAKVLWQLSHPYQPNGPSEPIYYAINASFDATQISLPESIHGNQNLYSHSPSGASAEGSCNLTPSGSFVDLHIGNDIGSGSGFLISRLTTVNRFRKMRFDRPAGRLDQALVTFPTIRRQPRGPVQSLPGGF